MTLGSYILKPFTTLDICDFCYKECINAQINVEKESLQQPKQPTEKHLEDKTTPYKGTNKEV